MTVAPSREDPFVERLSAAVGGPAGDHRAPGRSGWWTAVRVLIAVAMVALALGVVEKQHCRAQGWTTPDQFFHACYSDLPIVYQSAGLADGVTPYVDAADGGYLAQPVLTGLAMWAVAQVVPDGTQPQQARWYFDLSTLLIAVLLAVLVWCVLRSAGRRRPWDAAIVAASPLVALSALVSLDLLGVTLAAAGLLAWARRRPLLAGVLLGLATTARTYPAVLLVVLGLLALRAGQVRVWARTLAAAAVTVAAVLLPWLVLNRDGVTSVYHGWADSPAGYGSLWLLPQTLLADPRPRWVQSLGLGPTSLSAGAATTLAVLGLALALVAGLLLALAGTRRPRVAQVAFVVLAIVVVTGKAWPVQGSLWLLPLAALAHPRWRDQVVWLATEVVYFVAVWLYVAAASDSDRALPPAWYAAVSLLRVLGLAWLVWCVVRDVLRPELDVVRADGTDDPLGGPLEDAGDALLVRFG
nr:glycosyltransferase 87 family protein [Angustibacter aerolatus]